MLRVIFWLSFAAVGLYYEWGSALVSIALLAYLSRKKQLALRLNPAFLAAAAITLFYAVGWLWAVDSGVAAWGGVKHLPILLFALCLMQEEKDARLRLLRDIPWMGAAMVLLTFPLQFVPLFSRMFSVSGRLAGLFQYPNTFACFLLLGLEVLLLEREKPTWRRLVCGILVLFGLLQTGSRAVLVMTLPLLLVCLLLRKDKKTALWALAGGAVAAALAFGVTALGVGGADRVTEVTGEASTLLGRLLYWKDALPQILRRPLGLGYLGYYFTQGSFQTGVYSVRWAHNDLIQLLLDVGWLPAIAAVWAAVRSLLSRRVCALRRMVLLTLLGHCMFDFDLQFAAMYFIVLLCLDWEGGKEKQLQLKKAFSVPAAAVLSALCLWIGTASTLSYEGYPDTALKLWPWDTFSRMTQLQQIEDAAALDTAAQQILQQNGSVALAWDARALAAYARGDFGAMMEYKRQAIALSRYTPETYIDYFHRLQMGVSLYTQAGDTASAAICQKEILAIDSMVRQVLDETDPLAWRIADKPELTLPAEYYNYIAALQ